MDLIRIYSTARGHPVLSLFIKQSSCLDLRVNIQKTATLAWNGVAFLRHATSPRQVEIV